MGGVASVFPGDRLRNARGVTAQKCVAGGGVGAWCGDRGDLLEAVPGVVPED